MSRASERWAKRGSVRARGGKASAAITLAATVLTASSFGSSQEPPWSTLPPGAIPDWVRSVRMLDRDDPIHAAPDGSSDRRGSALMESRLPFYGAQSGPGCGGPWLHVGPKAWVCMDRAELSADNPIPADVPSFEESLDGLPFRYYFVGPDGSFGYDELLEVDVGQPAFQLDPGFAIAVVHERTVDGYQYGLTNNGLWVPMRDVTPVRSSLFKGEALPAGKTEVALGWVVNDDAPVYSRPIGGTIVDRLPRFTKVDIASVTDGFNKLYEIGEGRYMATRDVRRPTLGTVPDEVDVARKERWIDVELDTQTLVAWEGDTPVFATLVSTGKGRQGTANQTPKGVHRVWAKLLTSNMDNLEDDWANRYWRMEDVPYVQYFSKGVGLHGAFWHRSFGRVRSHGCVNLAPLDAQHLFWWTGPRLPAGWTAILPNDHQPGALVRVR